MWFESCWQAKFHALERGKKQKTEVEDRNCFVVEERNRKADDLRGPLVTPLS